MVLPSSPSSSAVGTNGSRTRFPPVAGVDSSENVNENSPSNPTDGSPESKAEIDFHGNLVSLSMQLDSGEIKAIRCESWTNKEKYLLMQRVLERCKAKAPCRKKRRKSETAQRTEGYCHVQSETKIWVNIGNEDAVLRYYARIFSTIMQTGCRKLAKWWIKAINPNKQTHNPYAGKSEARPWWWPETPPPSSTGHIQKGNGENKLVRHLEPDHLSKEERLTLLPFILNQVTNPSNLARLNFVNIRKLEQITNDSLNNETVERELHDSWRHCLTELFRVAREQERYKYGEIDDTTRIYLQGRYAHVQVKGLRDEVDGNLKPNGDSQDDAGHDRKLFLVKPLSRWNFQGHSQPQLSESDINQGCSNHIPNQVNFTAPMSILQHRNPVTSESMRYHSDTSSYLRSGPNILHYQLSTAISHNSSLQYPPIPPTYHHSTPNSLIGPYPPPSISMPIPRPEVDVTHPHTFQGDGLLNSTDASFHPPRGEMLLGQDGIDDNIVYERIYDIEYEDSNGRLKDRR